MKLGFKLTIFFLLFTLSTTFFLYLIGLRNQNSSFRQITLDHIKNVQTAFHNLEERDTHILSSALDVIVRDSRLKEVYLQKKRDDLYNYVRPLFRDLKSRHGITHFYFILPDGRVFLRMHDKEIYGDLVKRKSFQKARDTKEPAWEMELGKTAFALRSVMPYYNAGTLIGYVELGEQIDHFLKILKKETNSEYAIIGDKIYLDGNDWKSVRRVAGLRDNWEDLNRHLVISSTSDGKTSAKCFAESSLEQLEKGGNVVQQISGENRTFMCSGFDLSDAEGQHIGAILSLMDITDHAAAARKTNKTILRLAIMLFIITCMAGILISRTFSKPIVELTRVAKEVGRGNLIQSIHIGSNDEIGQLAETFNTMIEMRKQTEEALQKSEEKYRSLVESTDASIYLVDRNYRYLYMNYSYMRRLGFSGSEYLGRGYSEYHSAEATSDFMEKIAGVFETGESFRHEHLSRRDNRYFLRTLSPVKEASGKVMAVTVVSKEITDQKRAEMLLREERDKLQEAIAKIKQLSGMLPICASCKKIRDDKGYWTRIESYIKDHSEAEFSHSLCPDCAQKLYSELYNDNDG